MARALEPIFGAKKVSFVPIRDWAKETMLPESAKMTWHGGKNFLAALNAERIKDPPESTFPAALQKLVKA